MSRNVLVTAGSRRVALVGAFKNPLSHRPVEYADPTSAAEAVLFADLLHRLLDRTEAIRNLGER